MPPVQTTTLQKQKLRSHFAEVLAKVVECAYAPAAHQGLGEYVNTLEFGGFWHGCLGNMVSNWYLCRDDKLQRLHRYPGGTLNPSWAKNVIPVGGSVEEGFRYDDFDPNERDVIQVEIDRALQNGGDLDYSIGIAHRLFAGNTLWATRAEQSAGWLFVQFGEILIYCFEHEFLRLLVSSTMASQLWLAEKSSDLSGMAQKAWETVVSSHWRAPDESADDFVFAVNGWLAAVLAPGASRSEWRDWWETKQSKDWFVRWKAQESDDPMPDPSRMAPENWAWGICHHGGYESAKESLVCYPRRARFSAQAEQRHKSRNLVIFPLLCWGDQAPRGALTFASTTAPARSKPAPSVAEESHAIAYFVATFYDDAIIADYGPEIRALLSTLAQPDIIRIYVSEERNRQEQELLLTYARGIAHDLSHPLQAMQASLNTLLCLLPAEDLLAAKQARCLTAQMRRIQVMRDNLMDFSESGQRKANLIPASIYEIADEALQALAYEFESRGLHPMIHGEKQQRALVDPDLLLNAFSNIIINSLRAYDRKRNPDWKLDIIIGSVTDAMRDLIEVEFYDTGPGIAPEDLPHVTEPTFTRFTSEKGRGLGLWNVKDIVVHCGGKLEIASCLNEWTSVRIRLVKEDRK